MPPTKIHFNGSVNLPDASMVFSEVLARIPQGLDRVPDGETGDRANWIFFQMQRFAATPGLEPANTESGQEYEALPRLRLAADMEPHQVRWPDLGYAEAYLLSYEEFSAMRAAGSVSSGIRLQVQYPTPLASINAWIVPEHQSALEAGYEQALFADLDRLLARIPPADLAVQWDVAIEFGMLEGSFEALAGHDFAAITSRLVQCIGRVPPDVPVGLHLCYGDMGHEHFAQPESLALQVRLLNAVLDGADRGVDFVSFTVPQDRTDEAYFSPLAQLRTDPGPDLFFSLVPYHPDRQERGATTTQIHWIDHYLPPGTVWGISAECGLGRVPPSEVLDLIDLHRTLLGDFRP